MHLLFLSLLCSLLGYAVMFATLSGWGWVLARALGGGEELRLDLFFPFLGLCLILPIAEIVHLFHAINYEVSLLIIVPGTCVYLLKLAGEHLAFLRSHKKAAVIGVLVVCWGAGVAMRLPNNYDSGLYHFQTIRWLEEYPIVRGLANLHWHFGLNQSYFELVALTDVHPWFDHGHNLVNSFLALMVVGQCCFVAFSTRGFPRLLALFLVCALALEFAGPTVYSNISSPSPDPVNTFLPYSLLLLASLYFTGAIGTRCLRWAIPISVLAITVKFSSIFFMSALVAAMIVVSLRQWSPAELLKQNRVGLLLAVCWLGLWSGRGVLLSGYPLYPLGAGRANVDWAVPQGHPERTMEFIRGETCVVGFRKQYDTPEVARARQVQSLSWIRRYRHTVYDIIDVFPLAFCAGALVFLPWNSLFKRREALLIPVLLFAIVAWINAAPDPRFGYQFIWALAAVLLAFAMEKRSRRSVVAVGVVYCLAVVAACSDVDSGWVANRAAVINPFKRLLRVPRTGYQPVPVAQMVEHHTDEGRLIYSPKAGLAWKGPLPNTLYFTPVLRFRGPGLKDGFYTNPKIWP